GLAAGGGADAGLVEVARLVEGGELRAGLGGRVGHPDRGRDLDLADRDPGAAVGAARLGLRLEHDRGVADLVAGAQVAADRRLVRAWEQVLLEEADDIAGALQGAAGLGLQAEADVPAGAVFELPKLARGLPQPRRGGAELRVPVRLGPPADRQRG